MMKIVRFRARTVLVAGLISLVCFVVLFRSSYLFTGNTANEGDDGKRGVLNPSLSKNKMDDNDLSEIGRPANPKKQPRVHQIITTIAENVPLQTSAQEMELNSDRADSNRRAFKVVESRETPVKAEEPAKNVEAPTPSRNVEYIRPAAVTLQAENNNEQLKLDVAPAVLKYPALPKETKGEDFSDHAAGPGLGNDNQSQLKKSKMDNKGGVKSFVPDYLKVGADGKKPMYPILTADNKFIPSRRIVHLDLKGAAPKVDYFEKFFQFISDLGATGILLEYEETFPYSGDLASIRASNAYSNAEIKQILSWAAKYNLEVIPLIQTFGHLEWILKHERFAQYREVDRYAQVICLSNMDAVALVKNAIDQVMQFHRYTSDFVHIGADEAFQIGMCNKCQQTIKTLDNNRDKLMVRHIANISLHVQEKYKKRVLMWHDMLNTVDPAVIREYRLNELVEPVIWAYAENLNEYLTSDTWFRFSGAFPYIWGASAFKGADGPSRFHSNVPHYLRNHISWTQQMDHEYKRFREFRGLILTGWQRFDHFAVLCELLPVGIPSLVVNLLTIAYGTYNKDMLQIATRAMRCDREFNLEPSYGGASPYCKFPGAKIYQLVQQFYWSQKNLQTQLYDDYQLKGWLGNFNIRHNYSSAWYLDQIVDKIYMYKSEIVQLHSRLHAELSKVFHNDTVDEFLFEYVEPDVNKLIELDQKARALAKIPTFPARPFPILNALKNDDRKNF